MYNYYTSLCLILAVGIQLCFHSCSPFCLFRHLGDLCHPPPHPHTPDLSPFLQVASLRCVCGLCLPCHCLSSKPLHPPLPHPSGVIEVCPLASSLQVVYVYGIQTRLFCAVEEVTEPLRYLPKDWTGIAQWFGVTAFLFCIHSMVSYTGAS